MTGDVGAGDTYTFWNGAWDVHDSNRLCTAGGNNAQVGQLTRVVLVKCNNHGAAALAAKECGQYQAVAPQAPKR